MSTLSEVRYETTPPEGIEEHEYAKLFPMLDQQATDRLIDDIRENGIHEPIVFLGAAILDGRNRYYAARLLKIAYPRVDYIGDDPLGFVIGKNLHRRHLTDKQRADVGAKIAALPKGANQHSPIELPSIEATAEALDVSVNAIKRAKVVADHASPELKAAYDAGEVSPSAAAEIARLPVEEQAAVVAAGPPAVKEKAKEQRESRKAERQSQSPATDPPVKAETPAAVRKAAVTIDALTAEIEELREALDFAEAENTRLKAELAKFEDMRVLYEQGGFEAVIAAKDEVIRVQATRIERESFEKSRNLNSMRGLAKKLEAAGLGRNVTFDIETGEEVAHG